MHEPMRSRALHAVAIALVVASCASVDPRPDYERAAAEIRSTTGAAEVFDPEGPAMSEDEIRAALADGLGLEEATRLALLNNRRLQAGFLALGVARSDYVQSGLMRNPSLSLAFFLPDNGGRTRWTAEAVGSVSDLWEIPLRKQSAQAQLDHQVLELARFAGELFAGTKQAYVETVAAREAGALAREGAVHARRLRDIVRRQVEEGVATRTDENLAQSLALRAELDATRAEREEIQASRRLAALLSLEVDLLEVALADPLPQPMGEEFAREDLVALSLHGRADLRAASREIAAAEQQVALERRRAWPELAAGVSAERPEGGGSTDFLLGPTATIEIPLFDQNQAQVSRAEFRLGELRKEHRALVAEITQEVRAAADNAALANRAALFASEQLVPQAERGAALAERAYALGDTLVLALLEAQRALIEARRTAVEANLEAARARIALEKALGVPLDPSPIEAP